MVRPAFPHSLFLAVQNTEKSIQRGTSGGFNRTAWIQQEKHPEASLASAIYAKQVTNHKTKLTPGRRSGSLLPPLLLFISTTSTESLPKSSRANYQ